MKKKVKDSKNLEKDMVSGGVLNRSKSALESARKQKNILKQAAEKDQLLETMMKELKTLQRKVKKLESEK